MGRRTRIIGISGKPACIDMGQKESCFLGAGTALFASLKNGCAISEFISWSTFFLPWLIGIVPGLSGIVFLRNNSLTDLLILIN